MGDEPRRNPSRVPKAEITTLQNTAMSGSQRARQQRLERRSGRRTSGSEAADVVGDGSGSVAVCATETRRPVGTDLHPVIDPHDHQAPHTGGEDHPGGVVAHRLGARGSMGLEDGEKSYSHPISMAANFSMSASLPYTSSKSSAGGSRVGVMDTQTVSGTRIASGRNDAGDGGRAKGGVVTTAPQVISTKKRVVVPFVSLCDSASSRDADMTSAASVRGVNGGASGGHGTACAGAVGSLAPLISGTPRNRSQPEPETRDAPRRLPLTIGGGGRGFDNASVSSLSDAGVARPHPSAQQVGNLSISARSSSTARSLQLASAPLVGGGGTATKGRVSPSPSSFSSPGVLATASASAATVADEVVRRPKYAVQGSSGVGIAFVNSTTNRGLSRKRSGASGREHQSRSPFQSPFEGSALRLTADPKQQPKQFQCNVCGKRFSEKATLQVHKRVHTGEKPYKCRYCPRYFAQVGNRIKHERTHTGARPFVCSVCNRPFSQSNNLRRHMRIHEREKAKAAAAKGKEDGKTSATTRRASRRGQKSGKTKKKSRRRASRKPSSSTAGTNEGNTGGGSGGANGIGSGLNCGKSEGRAMAGIRSGRLSSGGESSGSTGNVSIASSDSSGGSSIFLAERPHQSAPTLIVPTPVNPGRPTLGYLARMAAAADITTGKKKGTMGQRKLTPPTSVPHGGGVEGTAVPNPLGGGAFSPTHDQSGSTIGVSGGQRGPMGYYLPAYPYVRQNALSMNVQPFLSMMSVASLTRSRSASPRVIQPRNTHMAATAGGMTVSLTPSTATASTESAGSPRASSGTENLEVVPQKMDGKQPTCTGINVGLKPEGGRYAVGPGKAPVQRKRRGTAGCAVKGSGLGHTMVRSRSASAGLSHTAVTGDGTPVSSPIIRSPRGRGDLIWRLKRTHHQDQQRRLQQQQQIVETAKMVSPWGGGISMSVGAMTEESRHGEQQQQQQRRTRRSEGGGGEQHVKPTSLLL